jgi:hypothetical protein
MRLFLIGWDGYKGEFVDVAEGLQKNGHEIVYWTSHEIIRKVDRAKFPHAILHEVLDALALKPAPGVDTGSFTMPSAELIAKLYETESTVLTMMNKKYEWMGVSERKHVYYRMIQYWDGVLQKYAPDAIIFPVVPHTVYDYVIYALAKLRNIRTIMFDLTRVNDDRLVVVNDYKEGSAALISSLAESDGKQVSPAELEGDIKAYYEKQTKADSATDRTPLDVVELVDQYSGRRRLALKIKIVWHSLKDFTIFKKIWSFVSKAGRANLKTEYERLQSTVDINRPFIYVPLNYQPERTTSPTGGVFVDQLLMVEMLSASAPAGWVIYVKEHPFQWLPRGLTYFSYRYRGYYEALARLPNVRLIPIATSNYVLVDKAQTVATVTGTAGWEAMLRGKPALVFGYPWYRHCAGAIMVSGVSSCRQALEKIISGAYRVDQAEVIRYLFCFGKISFRGYVDAYGKEICTLTPEENKQNFLEALVKELHQSFI